MYLHSLGEVTYYDFYTDLLNYIFQSNGKLNKMWNLFKEKYENSLSGNWNYYDEKFGNVTWFFEEGAFIEIASNYNEYLEELLVFLKKYDFPEDVFSELLKYQKLLLKKPLEKGAVEEFSYDFYSFFDGIVKGKENDLAKIKTKITVEPKTVYDEVSRYAKEVVWFGRRRGATIYGSDEVTCETV
jgi:hypothetical protein